MARQPATPKPPKNRFKKDVDPQTLATDLALKKLATSGITPTQAKTLRLEFLSGLEVKTLNDSYSELCAIKIPYLDPSNLAKPLAARPSWPAFYRLRYLRQIPETKGDIRYTNEPGAGVCAYFPPCVNWPALISDVTKPLIITEGEFKAAKASLMGHATIGLGGVWNFRAKSLAYGFLPELEGIAWAKRDVYIIFDSDILEKEGVQNAFNALSSELHMRGALVYLVLLPPAVDGSKQGLDDWVVANPSSSIARLIRERQPITEAKKFWALNNEYVVVRDRALIVNLKTFNKSSLEAFSKVNQNMHYHAYKLLENGEVSLSPANVATEWLKWPMRNSVIDVTYLPGKGLYTEGRDAVNLWRGWGCKPLKGDIKPFITLLDHVFEGAESDARQWFLMWLAYPIKHPGTKLYTASVIHGTGHGTGKSLIGYSVGRVYGRNFTEISQGDLQKDFNPWADCRQFVMGDDVTGSDKRSDNDVLKKLITQRSIWINTKHVPEFEVPDCINYLFTSNHPDAFFLEDNDRRFFIHEVTSKPLDTTFYTAYGNWLDGSGASALFYYLLNEIDVSAFNPYAPAPLTRAKMQMMSATRSDLATWVRKLISVPEEVLKVGEVVIDGDLFTAAQLLSLYDPSGASRVTATGLARELLRASAPRANRGEVFDGPAGTDRYFILRNVHKWIKLDGDPLVKALGRKAKGVEVSKQVTRKY